MISNEKSEETCPDRVRQNTREEINARIDRQIERNTSYMSTQSPEVIQERLIELDGEIDIETLLGRMSSTVSLAGLALGAVANKRLLIIPAMIQAFYLNHMIRGWCPPLPVLRRLGVRTSKEIEKEKQALMDLLANPENREQEDASKTDHNGQNGHSKKVAKQEAK